MIQPHGINVFLKEFWDRNHFEFQEREFSMKIFPVTIPMHYLANNVTMVQGWSCYQVGGIRDGALHTSPVTAYR